MRDALVLGFAVTGQAAARALRDRGLTVIAVDDGAVSPNTERLAADLGVELVARPPRALLAELAGRAELIVLSPGVPPSHPIFDLAHPDKIVAEIELAFSLSAVPVVAITGTNGKTTVTSLVTEILRAAGMRAEAVGNIGRPFIEAVSDSGTEIFVVEVSSFQLAWTKTFRPSVACWLNLAEDHLDWHASLDEYAAAKARVWANQGPSDVAVVNADDAVVMKWSATAPGRAVTFGRGQADFAERGGVILGPDGPICAVSELPRSLPHDVTNACAAAAVAMSAGADAGPCAEALRRGVPMPHRIEFILESEGIRYYDDSKATTPSAVLAALTGLDPVILIAGGRNKGLDLGAIVDGLEQEAASGAGPGLGRLRGVIAIGESAADIVGAFGSRPGVPVHRAGSMAEAVDTARAMARAGDSVLLSPGCASFDWYRSYAERGDDFARVVRSLGPRDASGGAKTEDPGDIEMSNEGEPDEHTIT
ncbi:MAG: UDP-N-acetylmuramoyl-L-alanine--D-glutamate ligase [Acidimicrobiales bacterium]